MASTCVSFPDERGNALRETKLHGQVPCLSRTKGRSAGSWKVKTTVFPLKLKLQGCLHPHNNGPGTDTPAHRPCSSFPPQPARHYTGQPSALGKSWRGVPPHLPTPHRGRGQGQVGPQLALSCCPDPRLFSRKLLPWSFRSTNATCKQLAGEAVGVGEGGGRCRVQAPPKLRSYTFFP